MIKTNILVNLSLTGLLIFGSCGKGKNKTPQDSSIDTNKPIDPTKPPIEPNKPIDPETVVTGTQCGQPDGFIGISTKEELQSIGSNLLTLQGNYFLCNDIDLKGINFEPIGETYKPFLGQFDGNNKKILNLTIKSNFINYNIALFGSLGSKFSKVSNVHLENVDISSEFGMASLVASNMGTVENCSATGVISSSNSVNLNSYVNIGGLVGINSGYITKSYSRVTIDIEVYNGNIGGLVGSNSGVIDLSYATGIITIVFKSSASLGGLVGEHLGVLKNSYAIGDIRILNSTYAISAGGLAGRLYSGKKVSNSYASGKIYVDNIEQTALQTPNDIGGLFGYVINGGEITNSYYPQDRPTGSVSSVSSSTGTGTAIDITKQQSLLSGFSASDWKHTPGQWPLLAWQ